MTALTKPRMTVDEFLASAEERPGRLELFKGEVYAMSPETVGHAKTKLAVHIALVTDIRRRHLPCHPLPDGVTVRVDDTTAYEPDGLVYCGQELPPTALEAPEPIIIVEIVSPSSRRIDMSLKLAGYFRLPSLAHYLVINPTQPVILHHARGPGEAILTRIVTEGVLSRSAGPGTCDGRHLRRGVSETNHAHRSVIG